MSTLAQLRHTWKSVKRKIRKQFTHDQKKQFVKRDGEIIDWISETLHASGVFIKMNSKKNTNTYNHEKNSI